MSYPESYFTERESWRDWRIEASELIRAAQIRNGSRVLEIGCGGGGLLRILRQWRARVVGVDTLDAALQLARKQSNSKERIQLVRIGADDALPLCTNAFDAIIGQHVIEHMLDAGAALCEWHRLLKPTGRLALVTPNADYPDPAHFADADHMHIFSAQELRAMVQQAGFAVESCFTIFPFLTHARWLRAMGVIAYNVFRFVPYFSTRGRTIVLAARKA